MPNKNLGPQILSLREEGLTYRQIQEQLGCSKGTISFHLGEGQKAKYSDRQRKNRTASVEAIVKHKLEKFLAGDPTRNPRPADYRSARQSSRLTSDKVRNFFADPETGRRRDDLPETVVSDVLSSFGDSPVCYLTGQPVDLSDPGTWSLDHIIPIKRGGPNSLENLGLTTREANFAKRDMTLEDFIDMCEKVARNFGRI